MSKFRHLCQFVYIQRALLVPTKQISYTIIGYWSNMPRQIHIPGR